MQRAKFNHSSNPRRQRGLTLIELLVAGIISLIAAAGMVIVMANTLGTGTQTIQMARMTQEMRTAMQIMSRELRRANYHAGYMSCYGNTGCLTNMPGLGDISSYVKEVGITDNGDSDCFWFWYDRPQRCPSPPCTAAELAAAQVPVTGETVAAFRHTIISGIGRLQMTTASTAAPNCNLSAGWFDITDPDLIDVTAFNVSDAASVVETFNAAGDTQSVERIALAMTARLTPDAAVPGFLQTGTNPNAARELTEFITVRNHTTTAAAAASP
jgi:Tfp pilus assembly protein PilW